MHVYVYPFVSLSFTACSWPRFPNRGILLAGGRLLVSTSWRRGTLSEAEPSEAKPSKARVGRGIQKRISEAEQFQSKQSRAKPNQAKRDLEETFGNDIRHAKPRKATQTQPDLKEKSGASFRKAELGQAKPGKARPSTATWFVVWALISWGLLKWELQISQCQEAHLNS